ncbi:MAG: ABC transporter permease [Gemmatimonadaceae bacterium]|nr:ABC transporter permease [Gemmatimonadaceae bacterium]
MSRLHPARQALVVVAVLASVAALAPLLAPYDPNALLADGARVSMPPNAAHWLGTDTLSRDVLSRLLFGARISLGIAFLAVGLAVTLGTAVGATAALAGRWVDTLLMRCTDALLAFPRILLLLLLVASLNSVSSVLLGVMIGATGWMTTARLVRQETRRLLQTEHLKATIAIGLRRRHILVHHLLPGLAPTLVAAGTIALAAAIPLEAALSFLGLGVPTPQASWGNIINEAQGQLLLRWWLVVFPTLAIVGTVATLNIAAERLLARQRERSP